MTSKNSQSSVNSGQTGTESGLMQLQRLGRYELKRKLGAGGMGAVYLALDTELNRLVALKVLPPEKAENRTLVKRFKAEAQAVAQLTHDNIVRVYESGEKAGYHYIALEYVEGTDVHRLIKKRGRIPIRRASEIITQVAQALEHAAEAGIVHRDIKPANLLITQAGVVKLTDLGLARVLDENETTSITRAGTTVGTVDYMAPEQARNSKAADIRSDIYSLGCTWYHMLTGTPPYPEGSVTNKLHAHAVNRIPDPRSINEAVPEVIVGVIQRMMAKKPEDRYQSPRELLEDMKAVKATKKEISAEDLAALASGDEDDTPAAVPVVTSRRNRADDDEDDVVTKTVSSTREDEEARPQPKKTGASSAADVMPPREKRSLSDVEVESGKKFNTDLLVYAGIAAGAVLALGAVWFVIAGIGQAIDQRQERKIDLAEIAQNQQDERNDSIPVPAVQGNGNANGNGQQAPRQIASTANSPGEPAPMMNRPASFEGRLQEAVEKKWPVVRLVDRNLPTDANSAHTLEEAVSKTTAKEFIVELQTAGMHVWEEPIVLDGRSLILQTGADKPGTILIKNTGALANGLITLRRGELFLQNLHFGLLGYDLPGENDLTLIRADDANVLVKNCSFTTEESRAAPVTLCQVLQGRSQGNRCLFEQSVIRGAFWKPFVVNANQLKLQLQGCLVLVAEQPVFTLNHPGSAVRLNQRGAEIDFSEREVAVSDSYVVCQGTSVVLHNSTSDLNVPPTQIRTRNSCFVTTSSGSVAARSQPFMTVSNWPENVLSTDGRAKLSLLNWLAEESQFAGWPLRLQASTHNTNNHFRAENDAEWQEFWGDPGLGGEWNSAVVKAPPAQKLSQASGQALPQLGLTAAARPPVETMTRLEQLPLPELDQQVWRATLAHQTRPTVSLPDPFTAEVPRLTLDLNKQDLGEFLAAASTPAKAIIEARGFGLRTCTPLNIGLRQFKIQFVTEPGRAPLTLRPIPAKGNTSGKSVPWMNVEGGMLILEKGTFRLDPPAKNPQPSAFIEARGGRVQLRQCYVTAPLENSSSLKAIVQMNAGEPNADTPLLHLESSYLQSGGTLVQVDLQACRLLADNCVLVSQGYGFDLRHAGGEKAKTGWFEVTNCTLAARRGSFYFDLAAPAAHVKPFVQGFLSENVFAPPVPSEDKNAPAPVVIAAKGNLDQLPSRLWWWETRNGYAPAVAASFQKQPLEQIWPQFWGPGHVTEPLFGPEGVLLKEEPINVKQLRPSSFTLFSQAKATRWGQGEKPLGAATTSLDLSHYETEKKPGEPDPAPANNAPAPRF